MPIPIPDTPELSKLRSAVRAAQANYNALVGKAAADRASLEPLSHGIAEALANGKHDEADKLRSERSAAEVRLRDYEAASRIASDRMDAAERALALVEAPQMAAVLRDESKRFTEMVSALVAEAHKLRTMRPEYSARFARCEHDPTIPHPEHPKRVAPLPPLAARVFSFLADYTPEA